MTFSVFQALRNQPIGKHPLALGLAVLVLISFSLGGCRSDKVTVDAKDPNSPQFTYRKDELALLQMSADDIQELERKKRYGTIYDDYASDSFKKGVGRRQFMIMANCVESFLGDLEEYDRNDVGFRREFLKDKGGSKGKLETAYIDVLNRKVQRALGSIEEQLVFVPNGLSFQLNGLYWIAKDKSFLRCMAQSGQLDVQTAPRPELFPDGSEMSTESDSSKKEPDSEEGTQNADERSRKPDGETGSESSEKPESGKPEVSPQVPVPAEGANSLESKPVQQMKPAEIRKEPLKARPAGAGAVVDQRPLTQKAKNEQKEREEAEKRRIELETQDQGTVPLPTAPGSDD